MFLERLVGRLLLQEPIPAKGAGHFPTQLILGQKQRLQHLFQPQSLLLRLGLDLLDLLVDLLGIDVDLLKDEVLIDENIVDEEIDDLRAGRLGILGILADHGAIHGNLRDGLAVHGGGDRRRGRGRRYRYTRRFGRRFLDRSILSVQEGSRYHQ